MSKLPPSVTRLYRSCDIDELQPDDPRFVDFSEAGGIRPADRIATGLRRADPAKPCVKLLAGHRGIGKTSELLRLKRLLETPGTAAHPTVAFKVIYFDVNRALDINDLDFPDLLVFAAAEVQAQLKAAKIPGFKPSEVYLVEFWENLKGLLGTEVELGKADLDLKLAKVSASFRNRPNSRDELRKAVEKHSASLLAGVNDLLQTATLALRKHGTEGGLVLLIDGLDKLVFRALDNGHSNTHIRLFCDRSEQLASLNSHVVYTVPISLYYSPRCSELAQSFGEAPVPMPMIRLRPDKQTEPDAKSPGMKKLWEVIKLRADFAQVTTKEVFDTAETGHFLCRMSGGHARHLMMFMRSAMDGVDQLPITRKAANEAIRNFANSLLRQIPDNFWPKLRTFATPQTDIPKDEDHQQMLFLLHIFEYMNGSPWYEINPVIRELERFKRVE